MKYKIASLFFLLIALVSCGEYNKVLKLTDIDTKFEYAKKYFNEGKFSRSVVLLEEVVQMKKASSVGGEALYLLAQSYYGMKDYITASEYFSTYYKTYSKGEYAELARYYAAYGLYLESPDPRLDQTQTYKAMEQFQDFIELYPQSEQKEKAQNVLFLLQEKLALKELLTARLYYNLGEYLIYPFPGGNYLSCVITAQNAMRSYPSSKQREEFMYYIFKSKYEMAMKSVDEKQDFRYRDVVDEYYSYINEYPEGKYAKEIQLLYQNVNKKLKQQKL
ncbi:MAG: outer membrane protein assembly factor BamD [Dysgonamonadaceae bacterium]|nr:outer membrane protein assembly factor BamD [Dysgonamonadaceae bacterium]